MDLQPIAPALALIGTVSVGIIGFYQWKKQNGNANRAANAAAQREAYEGLWRMLEQINIDLRRPGKDGSSIDEQLLSVNTYFLSHSLYFGDRDQSLIADYVKAMKSLQEKILASNDADVRGKYKLTGNFDNESIADYGKVLADYESKRALVKEKVRKVAGSV